MKGGIIYFMLMDALDTTFITKSVSDFDFEITLGVPDNVKPHTPEEVKPYVAWLQQKRYKCLDKLQTYFVKNAETFNEEENIDDLQRQLNGYVKDQFPNYKTKIANVTKEEGPFAIMYNRDYHNQGDSRYDTYDRDSRIMQYVGDSRQPIPITDILERESVQNADLLSSIYSNDGMAEDRRNALVSSTAIAQNQPPGSWNGFPKVSLNLNPVMFEGRGAPFDLMRYKSAFTAKLAKDGESIDLPIRGEMIDVTLDYDISYMMDIHNELMEHSPELKNGIRYETIPLPGESSTKRVNVGEFKGQGPIEYLLPLFVGPAALSKHVKRFVRWINLLKKLKKLTKKNDHHGINSVQHQVVPYAKFLFDKDTSGIHKIATFRQGAPCHTICECLEKLATHINQGNFHEDKKKNEYDIDPNDDYREVCLQD
jgi:hypothetical protein